MKKIVLTLTLLLAGVASANANWTQSPPSTVTAGSTSYSVAASATAYPGYSVTYLVIWVNDPANGWYPVAVGTGVDNNSIQCSGSKTFNVAGNYPWTVRLQTSGPSGSPNGTELASATTVANPAITPTTFSFGNLSHTYNGATKTATVTPTPGNATYTSDLTKGPGAGSYTVSATANGNFSGSGSATLTISKANQATLNLSAATSQQYGLTQTLSSSGGSGGGGVSYVITGQSAGGNASLAGAVLTANAGSGWVDVRADKAADANYNATSSSVVRVNLTTRTTTFSFGNLSHTYDGSTKTATTTPSPSGATYSSDLTKGPTAGSYTVSTSANGNYSGSGSATLTISKANQGTLTLNAATSQQYATDQTLSASGGSGSGGVSYVITGWSTANNVTLSGATLTANASSGWVDIRADKAADANYNATSSSVVRVNLATRTTTFSFGNLSHTYDGSAKTATTTPSPSGATYSSDLTKGPTAGSYTVSATANGNYSGAGSATLTISQASQATLTLNASTSQQYATDQTLSASGGSGSGGVSYVITGWSTANNVTLTGAVLTANAGSGWVDIRADKAADANYTAASSAVVRVNLATRTTTFSFGNLSHTYDGSAKTATASPTPTGATYSSDLTKGPTAGSYTVSTSANGNYSGSGSATLTIAMANQATLTLNAATTQSYTASQTLSTSGGSGGGAVSYVITAWSTANNVTLTGATLTANASSGWVDIRADKAADANYNATSSSTVRVNLTTAVTSFSFGNLSHTYDGSAKTATTTPSPSGATYGSDLTKGPTAGSYTVSATANGNYSGSGSATLTIAKANQATLTLNASTSQQYATDQTLSTSGGSGGGGVSYAIVGQSAGGNASLSGAVLTANASSGWVDVQATKATDTNYNATTSGTVRVNLTARTTTFTLSQPSFTYNGSAQGPSVVPSPAGATFSTGGTLSQTNVGSYTATATATGNYSGSNSSLGWNIAVSSQTITFNNPGTQTYGTPLNPGATASSGLTVSYSITSGPATVSGSTVTFTGTGSVTVRASQGGDSNYGAAANVDQTFSVNAANQTITFNNPGAQAYGTPLNLGATASSGLGVTYVVTSGPATVSGSTVTFTGTGSVTITASQAGNSNYNAASNVAQSFTVNPGNQTITFNNPGAQAYGTPLTLGATASSGLSVSYAVTSGPATVSGSTVTFTGTGSVTITASQAGNSNYNAASNVAQSFTVNPGNQTITFNNPGTQLYGTPLTLGATASSGLGVTYAIISGPATVSGNTVTFTGVGTVVVRASQAGNANYNAAGNVDQSFTVNPGNQTITFNNPGTQTYGTPLTLGATASSGLSVSYAVTSGPATVSGSTVTFTGVGTVVVRASQAGNANYNAAGNVDQSFSVNKATPTGTFASRTLGSQTSSTYTVQAGDLNATFTGPGGAATPTGTVTYSIVGPGTAVTAGSTLTLATYTIRASYPGDANYDPTTADATWTVSDDSDGDGVKDYIEIQLGTNPNVARENDSSNQAEQNIHQPN